MPAPPMTSPALGGGVNPPSGAPGVQAQTDPPDILGKPTIDQPRLGPKLGSAKMAFSFGKTLGGMFSDAGQVAKNSLVLGAGTAAAAGVGIAATKIWDAATKSRDFKKMLEFNPDLAAHQESNPALFNQQYSSLRSLAPDLAKDPLTAGTFMRQMNMGDSGGTLTQAISAQKQVGSGMLSDTFFGGTGKAKDTLDPLRRQQMEQDIAQGAEKHRWGRAQEGRMSELHPLALDKANRENTSAGLVEDREEAKLLGGLLPKGEAFHNPKAEAAARMRLHQILKRR